MRTYTYSEARQRLAALLDQARREGGVQIRRQDGTMFVVEPVVAEGSPLDVPGVAARLRRGELVALVREERRRSGDQILRALSKTRSQVARARRPPAKPRARPACPRR